MFNTFSAGIDFRRHNMTFISHRKWNESCFRPLLCTYRLVWAERTTSRSRRIPTILSFRSGWGRNIFISFKQPSPGKQTPNSSVKGSGANYYPRAPVHVPSYLKCFSHGLHLILKINVGFFFQLHDRMLSSFVVTLLNSYGQGGGPRVVVCTAAFHARVQGSVPGLGGLKETKIVSSPSTCESQYCGEPPWPRGSVLGLRPPGLEFRILCLEDSVISFISSSSGGSPGPV